MRSFATNSALNWLREQVDAEQGINGDASATIWAALAILISGGNEKDDTFRACLEFLESLIDSNAQHPNLADLKCSLAKTEVRSSAIAFRALGFSGMSMVDVPMQRSVDWLLCRESHRAILPLAPSEMSGWSAQGGSVHCIDTETTSLVLLALREQFTEKPPEISRTEDSMVAIVRASSAKFARRQVALLDRMAAASRRSRHWLVEIQNVDGGWGRFGRSPFQRSKRKREKSSRWSKDLQRIDASSVSTTGWVIEALSQWDHRREVVLSKAIGFLRNSQESDGGWSETGQSIMPTWRAISGMISAGISTEDPAIANAVAWLMSEQSKSGGWCDRTSTNQLSSTNRALPSVSVVHTAWAILGLMAAGVGNSSVVERGVQFLTEHQHEDGGWGVDELACSYRASLDCGTSPQDAAAYPLLALAAYHRVASP